MHLFAILTINEGLTYPTSIRNELESQVLARGQQEEEIKRKHNKMGSKDGIEMVR